MIRRQWIEPSESIDVLEQQLKRFFEVTSLDEAPHSLRHAARKSTPYSEEVTRSQLAWLFRARHMGRSLQVAPFSRRRVAEAVQNLRGLALSPSELHQVPRILREAGIRFVVIQPLPGTKIDGACIWLDDGSPIIAMSLRYDRIDNFWFTLLHECGHCSEHCSRPQ